MRVASLDLSLSASGVARWDGDQRSVTTLRPPGLGGMERLEWIMRRVVEKVGGYGLVCIEGYAFAARNTHAHALGELGGVVRLALFTRGVPVVDVPPSSLKKFATGKGNAGKELVLVEAVKRLGYPGADNNEADALWMLEMARVRYGVPGAVDVPKAHLAGLDGVKWPDEGAIAA